MSWFNLFVATIKLKSLFSFLRSGYEFHDYTHYTRIYFTFCFLNGTWIKKIKMSELQIDIFELLHRHPLTHTHIKKYMSSTKICLHKINKITSSNRNDFHKKTKKYTISIKMFSHPKLFI